MKFDITHSNDKKNKILFKNLVKVKEKEQVGKY